LNVSQATNVTDQTSVASLPFLAHFDHPDSIARPIGLSFSTVTVDELWSGTSGRQPFSA